MREEKTNERGVWKDQPILGWVRTTSKDQAANLPTHRHEKGERREQTRMKDVHDV
jgi:hypothetical protein